MRNVTLLRKDSHELRMRKMAEEILENGLSEHAARVRYQIKSIDTVRKWVRTLEDEKFLMAGDPSSKPKPPGVVQKLQQHTDDLATRIKQLEAALQEADIKALYYEQMVRTAEKELGIDIQKKVRYQVIHELTQRHSELSLDKLCRLSGISRQAYYKYFKKQHPIQGGADIVVAMVRAIRLKQPQIGVHKLYSLVKEDIKKHNIKMGRDGLYSLLAEENLLVKKKKRKPSITTNSKHWFRKYSNLICGMQIIRPNQLWVSDITYFPIERGFLYISLVTDAYSRRIMGYAIADNLEAFNSLLALEMALHQIGKGEGKWLIHHSDRGVQYCCTSYVRLLKKYSIQISMTEKGDPLENAIAERINRTIKEELLDHLSVSSLDEAITEIEKAVFIYNYERPHMSCGMLTPDKAHSTSGTMKKYWKKETENKDC